MTAPAQAAPPQSPAYMRHLVDRAASLLHVHGLGAVVSLSWWADGEDHAYTARLHWDFPSDPTARVQVFDARSGDFVCRSMPGDWLTIDATTWCLDVAEDVVSRELWEQQAGRRTLDGVGVRKSR